MIVAQELDHPASRHAFFTREGGVSKGIYAGLNIGLGSRDNREHVLENRSRATDYFSLPLEHLVTPYQIHSTGVLTVRAPFSEDDDRRGDALVTDQPDLILGIATADCGPVLFLDPKAKVIGAAHAGWKGAIGGILENTLVAMEALGADRQNTIAVLGPTISQKAYEVGPEFRARFLTDHLTYERYFIPSEKAGHFHFDLPAFIQRRLTVAGCGLVRSLDRCTYSDEDAFFSYRRTTHRAEPDYGRLLSAIVLRDR